MIDNGNLEKAEPTSSEQHPPHENFREYASSLLPHDATGLESIGIIQESARRYNEIANPDQQVDLLYHFTDDQGVQGIRNQAKIEICNGKLYLTSISPEQAKPLFTTETSRAYEIYFRDKKMPESLKERLKVVLLGLRFKWEYDILGKAKAKLGQKSIPVGGHKLENVIIIATKKGEPAIKKDPQGEIFIDRPIQLNSDSQFSTFGPFSIKS